MQLPNYLPLLFFPSGSADQNVPGWHPKVERRRSEHRRYTTCAADGLLEKDQHRGVALNDTNII